MAKKRDICNYLDPACFMANVFANCPEKTSFDTTQLCNIRYYVLRKLPKLIKEDIIIEWTRNSFLCAIEDNPNLFKTNGKEVIWNGPINSEIINYNFNYNFSEKFVKLFWQTIKKGINNAMS